MTYLFKYLKPFVPLLVLAVMFLALQAYGELTLPTYSADLVDSGISRGGIDSAAPEAMLSSTFDALISTTEKYDIFTETDREFLKNSYTKIYAGDEKYIKKYPVVSEQDIVVRNKLKTNEKENLSTVTGKALILLASMQQMMLSSTSPPPESIMEETMASVNQMSESTLLAATTEIIKQNYTTLGIDLDKFSNDYVIMNGLKMLGFAFIIMVAIVFESFLAGKIGAGFGRDIRRAIFEKIISFSANETDKFGTASLITRSTNDVQQVQMIVPMVLRFIVYAPILGIGGIIKVLATDVSMTWIIGLAVAVMSVIVVIMFLFAVPKFKIAQTLVDKVNLVMRESLNGLMVVRAFSNEQHEEKKFRKAASDLMNLNIFITKIMWTMMPLMMFLFNAVTLLIVWVGTKQIDAGNMEIGSMMAFISYSMQIISAFLMISMLSMMAPRAIVAGKRIADVLKTDVSVKDESNNTKLEKLNKVTVQFKNVSFKYPGAEEYVLKNISFTAKPGETTAFIGSAGSG
ncbi:MAG: ABC transporter ATP-binding protein, partial [Clostridiales bacterium]|nr:ABC transporter ATP-binding protein [Clostridiales bacterium]